MPYLDDYLGSLTEQEFSDFDLVLINDGLDGLCEKLGNYDIDAEIFAGVGSVPDNRRRLIEIVVGAGYEKIIFTDCDDFYPPERFRVSEDLLQRCDAVVNDLDLVSETGEIVESSYLSRRLSNGQSITSQNLIHSNMMGLTNTAVRCGVLARQIGYLRGDLDIFDWYLWSHVLQKETRVSFTSLTSSQYRVYAGNTLGLPQPINELSVRKGIKVKRIHYQNLAACGEIYNTLFRIYSEVQVKSNDLGWLDAYVAALQEVRVENPMWWENIRTPGEVLML